MEKGAVEMGTKEGINKPLFVLGLFLFMISSLLPWFEVEFLWMRAKANIMDVLQFAHDFFAKQTYQNVSDSTVLCADLMLIVSPMLFALACILGIVAAAKSSRRLALVTGIIGGLSALTFVLSMEILMRSAAYYYGAGWESFLRTVTSYGIGVFVSALGSAVMVISAIYQAEVRR